MSAADVDFSLLNDVMTEVGEHLPLLERELHQLVSQPQSSELLASAFRRVHTVKGDFGYCRAQPIAEFVHRLESVLQSLRERRFLCSALVAEALLQSMDQVQAMMNVLARTGAFDRTPREGLCRLIEQLAQAGDQAQADQLARHILMTAHGEWLAEPGEVPASRPDAEQIARAIALGEQLAGALAQRVAGWRERAALQRRLVLALNQHYLRPSDPDILTIAVLWHDVGMLALPDALFRKTPTAKSVNWPAYAAHPETAAQWLLAIAPGCQEAAQIIGQHHLWVSQGGFSAPDYAAPLHQGALMIACADLLHGKVAGLHGEDYRRAVLRTVFEVNGGLESRFDAALINAFQAVARDFTAPV
ncbi:Hpt domain-containing protein [Chitinimonas sp.]|uniref:Hpt domain-containing protein n=1 Tax=Chitinimonas sp. TaxID=1934313 RepID=UPI0035B2E64D